MQSNAHFPLAGSGRRRPLVVFAVLGLLGSLLGPTPAGAQQQNEIVLSVDFDGTASFSSADAADDGAGAHTPGLDLNANNNVVRTYDQIQYRIDWNVNEVDGSATTLRMTLPEGVEWLEDASTITGVPSGCTDDGTSSITGNDGRDLVCVTDAEHEGSNGAIHPRAFVTGLLDATPLTVDAAIQTGQAAAVVSNEITTYVSARPAGNWIKGDPITDADSGDIIAYEPDEMYWDVEGPDGAGGTTTGRIFVWSLRLEPVGGLKGSEPMDDSQTLQLWDHFFDAVPGTQLATSAQMLAATGLDRVPCGGYDGDGSYPFGVTDGIASATPAEQTNVGTWSCSDMTGTSPGPSYPWVEIEITGQDTSNIATQNANLSPNSATLASGQIAFWAPESALIAKAVPRIVVNAITGSTAELAQGTTDVDPIQVYGTNGAVDELSEPGNGLAGISNNSPYEFPTSPPADPGRSMRHWVRYANGPYQEVEMDSVQPGVWRTYDSRETDEGGTGRVITNGQDGVDEVSSRWDGDGQTPRGNVLSVISQVQTTTSNINGSTYSNPIHLCVAVDNTNQEVIGMPGSFPLLEADAYGGSNANAHGYAINQDTIGGSVATPATGIAQVLSSIEGGWTSVYWPTSVPTVRTDKRELDYVIEVAEATSPGNTVAINGVSCNGGDATWYDASGDLTALETGTMPDGTPIYGNVTHFRVRTSGDVPWQTDNPNSANNTFASRVFLGFQVKVKDDPVAQAADQELFVYAARASGVWDGTGQPPTDTCTNSAVFGQSNDFDDDDGIPLGWCNLDFTDDAAISGGDSTDLTDFKNDFDSSVVEYADDVARPRLAHADAVYIVEPALAISKVNTDGPADITANGQIVEFEINPKVVGSSLDEILDVTVTDELPPEMEFVGFTTLPDEGTCTEDAEIITCEYGDQAGGWGALGQGRFSFEVRIRDAGANATLTNEATISGDDSQTGIAKDPATSSAQAFTGAPFEESGIEKAVDEHITTCFETPGSDMDLGDCTVIATDSNMVFTLDVENEGNVDLDDYRVIDVFPHDTDASELASLTLTGDGRTPPSNFTGDVDFVGVVAPAGATVLYTAEDPADISRDPGVADTSTTWCDAPVGGSAVPAGLAFAAGTEPCPTSLAEVTAVHVNLGTLDKGATEEIQIHLQTVGADCGDIWTNNFGARTSDLLLPIRSNDVSVMAGFCDPGIDIEKDTNGLQSDTSPGAQIVAGDPVTWTYVVTNTGDVALSNATVTDSDAAVSPDCDVDGDDTLDGTNVIPLLVPNQSVTCEASSTAVAGPYMNNSAVTGAAVLPDFSDPAVDPADPTTWPTTAASYSAPVDPVTGGSMIPDQSDADPSHYTGIDPVPTIDIEKDTNGVQSDTAPGENLVAGEAVTWTYVVTNTGTAALVDATVTDVDSTGANVPVDCDVDGDDVLDGTNVIALLVPSASVTCSSTGVAQAGPYANNATVTGDMTLPNVGCVCDPDVVSSWPADIADYTTYADPVSGDARSVSDADPSHYIGLEPSVDIEKDTNGVQSDTAPGESMAAGDTVTWTYVVTNDGPTALLDAVVTDSDPAVTPNCDIDGDGTVDGTDTIPLLVAGASVTCEATGLAIAGAYTNTATVSGTPAVPDFSDPAIDPADSATWPTDAGDYTVPDGTDGEPVAPVTDQDLSHYTGIGFEPAIDIEKDTNGVQSDIAPGEQIIEGEAVTWTYVVVNNGFTALANASVLDDDSSVTPVCDVDGDGNLDGTNVIPLMLPGDEVTCSAVGVAAIGAYTNTATVTGSPVHPDFSDPAIDATDVSTWPSDPTAYSPAVDSTGAAFAPVSDSDDSHYTGIAPTGAIAGVLWNDTDRDGVQDPGETPQAGVRVELLDEAGNPVLDANDNPIVTTTDANGAYRFDDVPPGNYRVRMTAPDGTVLTPGSGSDDDVDANGVTAVIVVGAGAEVAGIDAGLVQTTATLAFTGSSSSSIVSMALAMLMLGGSMVLATRRRRATVSAD